MRSRSKSSRNGRKSSPGSFRKLGPRQNPAAWATSLPSTPAAPGIPSAERTSHLRLEARWKARFPRPLRHRGQVVVEGEGAVEEGEGGGGGGGGGGGVGVEAGGEEFARASAFIGCRRVAH